MSNKGSKSDITSNYLRYMEVLTYVNNDYVDSVNLDDLVDYSIDKMLEKLDPHTAYIPKKDVQIAHAQLEGDFEGIGIEFNIIKDTIYVVAPISGGPSEQVGLLAGDKIVKVGDKTVAGTGITTNDVFGLLRGKKGTQVKLTIYRRGTKDLLEYTITRDKIPTYSVDVAYMIDHHTGYIRISRFAANTHIEFKNALTKLTKLGMKRLIIDLKDNPGGYLDRATKIADELISGNKLIVYTDGKGSRYDSQTRAYTPGLFENGAVIVLINEGSASASEIVSGALQDNDRGLIVGRRSFGKGLVQMPIELSDGSELRLTISRYYTPSGRSIQKPYDKENIDDYQSDLVKRYKQGEFFHADSIKFADSLKYKTLNGRTVYGGGGIMPDVFVPRDTSAYTPYMLELFNKNIIREYTLNYYSTNKKTLSAMTFEHYRSHFVISDQMMKDLIDLATRSGIKYNEADFQRSKAYLTVSMKAYIARGVWGNEGFYPIINETDEIYLRAMRSFDQAEKIEHKK